MKTLRFISLGLFAALLGFAMGSWDYYASYCRCTYRDYAPIDTYIGLGLRLALK